jgi:hypothetical protein
LKKKLLEIVNAEDKKNPYTDDQIAGILKIRRDEVTSLRNELQLPDSRKRREPYLLEAFQTILAKRAKISDRELTAELNKEGFIVSRFTVGQLRRERLPDMPAKGSEAKPSEAVGESGEKLPEINRQAASQGKLLLPNAGRSSLWPAAGR